MSMSPMFPLKMIFSMLGILLLWLAIPFTASAHTSLESTTPAKDEAVKEAVNEIQMKFNTPIAELSSFTVTSSDNQAVAVNDIKVDGSSMSGKPAQPLTSGTYKVQWKIVGEDSHPIEGSYTFSVAASEATGEVTGNEASSTEAAGEAAGSTDSSSASTSSTEGSSAATDSSSTSGDTTVENPSPTTSVETETTPADDATTDQKPASSDSTTTDDEKDGERVSPATWIITIAVILVAIIAAVTTLSKRRKK